MTQLQKIFEIMKDGQFRTLTDIQTAMNNRGYGAPVQRSVQRSLRELRRTRSGGHVVVKAPFIDGNGKNVFVYRLILQSAAT